MNLVNAEGAPVNPRPKKQFPTGPVTASEHSHAESVIMASGSVTEVKQKGVRKAALLSVARSWTEQSQNSSTGVADEDEDDSMDDDLDDDFDSHPILSTTQQASEDYAELTRDELAKRLLDMVYILLMSMIITRLISVNSDGSYKE